MEELIPTGWQIVSIGEVTLPIEKTDPSRSPNQVIDYLDISGIDNKSNRILEAKHYLGKDAPSRARQLIKQEDILFSTVRTYLKNIAMVPVEYDGQVASTGFSILRAAGGINSKFLFYYTLTQGFLNPLTELQRGSSYPAVRDDDVRIQKIPIAPYNEQKRIVAKIDELFSELDKGIESLKTAREQLEVYRQAVLKHAFEGKLTVHWRKQNQDKLETADQLLERIKREREAYYQIQLKEWEESIITWETNGKEGTKPTKPRPPQQITFLKPKDLDDLPCLPNGWGWTKVINFADKVTDGEHVTPKRTSSGYYLLSARNIQNGYLSLKNVDYVPTDEYQRINLRCNPQEGDILISCSGSVGRICRVPTGLDFVMVRSVALVKMQAFKDTSKFYEYLLQSPVLQKQIEKGKKATAQANLFLEPIGNLKIILCSKEEQRIIIEEIDTRLSFIEKLENEIEINLQKSEALRQSILKKAFSGKLVAQDPNDEPACVLLERIRAEKEAQKTESKKPKAKGNAA